MHKRFSVCLAEPGAAGAPFCQCRTPVGHTHTKQAHKNPKQPKIKRAAEKVLTNAGSAI